MLVCKKTLPAEEVQVAEEQDAEPEPEGASAEQRRKKKADSAPGLQVLRGLSIGSIFEKSIAKVQGAFAGYRAKRDQAHLVEQLTNRGTQTGSRRDIARVARFQESTQKHASAWLTAPLKEPECQLINGHFRVAVALRLGINPFRDVLPGQRCQWCKAEVGEDPVAHSFECLSNGKGDRNRRHPFCSRHGPSQVYGIVQ